MHIAVVRTEFVKTRGGAENYAVNLARTWVSQGHEITVICHRHNQSDAEGLRVVNVSRPKVLGPFKHGWFAKRAGQAAAESGADAVLCLARAYPGDVMRLGDGLHHMELEARYGPEVARRRGKLNPRHRELLKLERELFRKENFGLLVANSEMIRRQAVERFDADESRIRVIPNGVDPEVYNLESRAHRGELRKRHGIPEDASLVLFSGMDFRRKGLMQAARAFVELAHERKDAWFACVGPGFTDYAERLLQVNKMQERATFVGKVNSMAAWYGAADVFILPSLHDPSANAVTEALACGTPVITSRENGARQHIVDGENGWVLTNREDPAEAGQRLAGLVDAGLDPAQVAEASGLISTEENADRLLTALRAASEIKRGGQVHDSSESS